MVTTHTTDNCVGAGGNTGIRLGWVLSKDNGTRFGTITQLGNTTCAYEQALEPSFAAGPRGHAFGAFVESNASQSQIVPYYGTPAIYYTQRYDDALAFISISSNGTKFAKPVTLVSGGNISRPEIASYGDSIYIVFENISNGTSTIPSTTYPPANPISVQLVYSGDNGTTWHGPYILPGLNSSEYYLTVSPSIAISDNGTVAVAYGTNRSCLANCAFYGHVYGDDIVVSTSLTNGTTWKGPYMVHSGAGESDYYQGVFLTGLFQQSPETAIAWNGLTRAWEVAWAAARNLSILSGYYYSNWEDFQVSSGQSVNNGVAWKTALASPPIPRDTSTAGYIQYYNPAIGVENGTITLMYAELNQTTLFTNCGPSSTSKYLANSIALWAQNASDGVNWTYPLIIGVAKSSSPGYFDPSYDYQGHLGSVGYTSNGTLLLGYTFAKSNYYDSASTESYAPVELVVAQPSRAATTTLTVQRNGLPVGTNWGFTLNGNLFQSSQQNITITNVPTTEAVVLIPVTSLIPPMGYWQEYLPTLSGPGALVVPLPTIFYVNFTLWDGIAFDPQPLNLLTGFPTISLFSQTYLYSGNWENYVYCSGSTCTQFQQYYGCPFPWFLPAGQSLHLKPGYGSGTAYAVYNFEVPISYWSGTGAGSYTGSGSWANITPGAGINQTMWMLPYGSYTEYFSAPTLPASSSYSLTFDGQNLSGPGLSKLSAKNVTSGAYWVTHVQATSSEPGWEYFGGPSGGDPVLVPDQTSVNLSFAAENLSAPSGEISFHANGLTNGTVWQFAFNGTTLSSSTPWINVTAHPGVYPTAAYVVTSANGSAGYAPLAVPPVWNVTTGLTYEVNYTPAYRVDLVTGQGGSVSPSIASTWVAPGARKAYTATPAVGFSFAGWTGQGAGSYTGGGFTANVTANGPIVEIAAFYPLSPNRFNATFSETGIPNGTTWTLNLNGVGYASMNATLTVPNVYSCALSGSMGRYTVTIPFAYSNGTPAQTRYVAKQYPASICGGGPVEAINFTAQYFLTMAWTSGGNVSVAFGSTVTSDSIWVPGLAGVTIQATPAPGFIFLGWNGSGALGNFTGVSPTGSVVMDGPITEIAAFGIIYTPPPPRFWVSFHIATPFPAGQTWEITFNGANYSSSTSFLNITNLLAGSYAVAIPTVLSADGASQFAAVGVSSQLSILENRSVPVTFSTSYWVSISEFGGGSVSPTSGWFQAGTSIALNATPSGTNLFRGWTGTGAGSYTGINATPGGVRANGPLTEVATFVPPAPPGVTVASSFNSITVWAGLALVGLAVGVIVGLLGTRSRRRRMPPTAQTPPPQDEPAQWASNPEGISPGETDR